MKIFLDTSAIIAFYNADDRWHPEASRVMADIADGKIPLTRFYISDYVFDEAMTFIECVIRDHSLATAVGDALLSSPFTAMLTVDEGIFGEAWDRFKEGRGLSFTDCTSFALMETHGISHSLTFDRHFMDAGFQMLP